MSLGSRVADRGFQFPRHRALVCEVKDQAVSLCREQSVDKDTTQALCQQFTQVFLLDARGAEKKNSWVFAWLWRRLSLTSQTC